VQARELGEDRRVERDAPGEQLLHHDAQRVEVRARVHVGAEELLRRHVLRRAEHLARLREARVRADLREAEIQDLGDLLVLVLAHHEHVVGLEIAVHDAALVRVRQALRDVAREHDGARLAQAPLAREHVGEALAVHVLHGDVEQALGRLAEVEHAHDVAVREQAGRLGLALEAGAAARVEREIAVEDLHREEARDAHVRGAVHLAHAARGDAVLDAVPVAHDRAEQRIRDVGARGDAIARAGAARLEGGPAALAEAHQAAFSGSSPDSGSPPPPPSPGGAASMAPLARVATKYRPMPMSANHTTPDRSLVAMVPSFLLRSTSASLPSPATTADARPAMVPPAM
jgi:hypothetical protein